MRRGSASPAEAGARRIFREYGFHVESVPWIRAQHDGEFMALVIWPERETAGVVELLTRPDNTTIEITRIHVGTHAVRVYLRFDLPRVPATQAETDAEWDRIERALAGGE